jgi:hypothetical protein
MPRRPTTPPPKPPDFSPEKTYMALKKQLSAVDHLRGRHFREAHDYEMEWENLTHSILIHGFGEDSENVGRFNMARWAGAHSAGGMSEGRLQNNFDKRVAAYTALLKSVLAELELMMPTAEIAGAYGAGEEYQLYRDLKTIVGFATKDLFIVDNYLGTELFDVYMENAATGLVVRVLTNQVADPVRIVAEKFSRRGGFELRSSRDVHDRVIFVDDRCWVIGQSIKDAAKSKPTYIVEHSGAASMRAIYEAVWPAAKLVVRG